MLREDAEDLLAANQRVRAEGMYESDGEFDRFLSIFNYRRTRL
jgi:hypothetical protein